MVLLKTLKLGATCTHSLAFQVFGLRSPNQTHSVKRDRLKAIWAKENVNNKLLPMLLLFVLPKDHRWGFLFVNNSPDCGALVHLYI